MCRLVSVECGLRQRRVRDGCVKWTECPGVGVIYQSIIFSCCHLDVIILYLNYLVVVKSIQRFCCFYCIMSLQFGLLAPTTAQMLVSLPGFVFFNSIPTRNAQTST
jgi:hypothetical protein